MGHHNSKDEALIKRRQGGQKMKARGKKFKDKK
jgi:hypothetical protein